MVDVVFNDSEKGAMRCARRFARPDARTITAVIHTEGERPAQEEYTAALEKAAARQRERLLTGKALEGGLDDGVALGFCLDMGDIACPVTSPSRRELIADMFRADPCGEFEDMEQAVGHYWGNSVADREALIRRAQSGEPVRIWYSDAPYSLCGFYSAVHELVDYSCRITAVKLPRFAQFGGGAVQAAVSWGELEPGQFACCLGLEVEIPSVFRSAIALEWETLCRENAPLRAVINGRLHSVEEDFYDGFIRQQIPQGAFRVAELIGRVLGRYQLGIGDWLIAQRIRKLIEAGELTTVEPGKGFYKTLIKKA